MLLQSTVNAAHDAGGPFCQQVTVLAHAYLAVYRDTQVQLRRAASQTISLQIVPWQGIIPPKEQDFTFFLLEFHEVAIGHSASMPRSL